MKDGKLLIAKRRPGANLPGVWELPGGKVEPGEDPKECLARELDEELGIEARVGRLIGASPYVYSHGAFEVLGYEVEWVSGSLERREHDDIKFVDFSEVGKYEFAPADIPIVKMAAQIGAES